MGRRPALASLAAWAVVLGGAQLAGSSGCGNSNHTGASGGAGSDSGVGDSSVGSESGGGGADAGAVTDSGTGPDATVADAAGDAAATDSAAPDGPVADAGTPDAAADAGASLDAGTDSPPPTDAGPDGPLACVLDGGGAGIVCADAACVDPTRDPMNCGGCGSAGFGCEAGSICSMSSCQNIAGSLQGLRWQLPCTGPYSTNVCLTVVDGSDTSTVTTALSGASEQTYLVTLHFQGVVEEKTYSGDDGGGAEGADPDGGVNPQFFVIGGTPGSDGFNVYQLTVSEPPQTYFLNAGASGIFHTWLLDYVATIPMTAGATITLFANAIDNEEIENVNGGDGGPVLVPGVPPYPQGYDGQFIQMDVESVVPAP